MKTVPGLGSPSKPSPVVSIPIKYFSVATVALPLVGFVACIVITCWKNFEVKNAIIKY